MFFWSNDIIFSTLAKNALIIFKLKKVKSKKKLELPTVRKNEHLWEYFFTHKSNCHNKNSQKLITFSTYSKFFKETKVKLTPEDHDQNHQKPSTGLSRL